jgi:hypothetical protein
MTEKIVGYIFIAVGVLLILFAGYSVYSVFSGKTSPVELFKFNSISIDVGKNIPELKGQNLQEELITADMINKPLNITTHLLLMGFIASIGYKIAHLGTMLVRPIIVKLKGKPEQANSSSSQK